MPFVEANGSPFFYEEAGPPADAAGPANGPGNDVPVLIQHGIGRNSRFWRPWLASLSHHRRVIARDQRGHGRTPPPGPGFEWTIEHLVDDLEAFLDALGLANVHYVGESIGAVLGVGLAVRRPDRIASLTLTGMPADLRVPRSGRALAAGRESSERAKRELGSAGWGRELVRAGVVSGGSDPAYAEWVVGEFARIPVEVLVGIGRTLYTGEAPVADWLARLAMPVLLLAPSSSPITTLEDQAWIRERIPRCRLEVVDGPTHEVYVDRAEACIAAFEAFLDERR